MEIIKVIGYTVFMYLYLIVIIRIMGKREVGSLSIFDLAVYFTISDLITMSILDHNISMLFSVISVAVLCVLQKILAKITLKNKKVRDFIEGKKSIIIDNGEIDFNEMKNQNYTIDDLYTQMRDKGIDSICSVKWGILETTGRLSIITYESSKSNYPDPLISDGIIIKENLKRVNIDEQYLLNEINKKNIKNIKDIRLCVYCDDSLIFVFKSNKTLK
jgi:uncharacterized membrane protein YcaP (DUF421 family)